MQCRNTTGNSHQPPVMPLRRHQYPTVDSGCTLSFGSLTPWRFRFQSRHGGRCETPRGLKPPGEHRHGTHHRTPGDPGAPGALRWRVWDGTRAVQMCCICIILYYCIGVCPPYGSSYGNAKSDIPMNSIRRYLRKSAPTNSLSNISIRYSATSENKNI